MRVGAVTDKAVHQIDVGGGDVGVQVVAGDDRHVRTDNAAYQRQDAAFRVMIIGGEPGAVQHAVHAVKPSCRAQPAVPFRHHPIEEHLLDRAVRLRHRQQDRHRLPGAVGIHVGDEAGQFAQHVRCGRPSIVHHRIAAHQRASGEVGLRRNRREAVALDGKAQQRDARPGHGRPQDVRTAAMSRSTVMAGLVPAITTSSVPRSRRTRGPRRTLDASPITAPPPAVRRCVASPSGRCRSTPAPWPVPA